MFELLKTAILDLGNLLSYVLGGALLVVSSYTFYWLRRRGFHRRNHLGVETFNSYAHMIWTRNSEFAIRLLAFLGLALGCAVIVIATIYR